MVNTELQAPDRRKMDWRMVIDRMHCTGFVEQVWSTEYSVSGCMNCRTLVAEEDIDERKQPQNLHFSFIEQDSTSSRGSLTVSVLILCYGRRWR
jgi:hypothetical protein